MIMINSKIESNEQKKTKFRTNIKHANMLDYGG